MMLVAVAAMGFACAQETTEVAPEKQTKTITVNSDITRVAFNDGYSALVWQEGDTIGAYTDDADDKNVVSSAYPEAFTLEVSADATEVYAYYPYYSGNSSYAATAMSIGIKGTITQSEAGKITTLGAIPMVAVGEIYGSTVDLLFEPYACVLAYNVYGGTSETEQVTSIIFTGDKKSSGYDYEFDLTECDVREYTPANGYTQVNLTGNAQFVPNGTKPAGVSANAVFMPVAKQVYGAGSTIVVTTTEDTYTFTATGDINCNQGYATLNLNLAKAEKASENMPEIAEGDYILAVKSGSSYYAMAGTNKVSSNRMDQVEITSIFDTESITTNDVTLIWTITKTTGGYLFEYDSKYLYGSSSSNQSKIGNSTDNVITLADNGDGTYKVMSSVAGAGRALGQNVASKGFAFYQDKTLEDAAAYPSNFYIVPVSFVATPRIEVAKTAVSLGSGAAEGSVDVTLEYVTADEVDVESSASWLEATLNDSALSFSADANSVAEERSATVTLTAGDATATITFTQAAYVEVDPDAVKTYTFTITKDNFNTTSYAANNEIKKTSVATAKDGSKIEVEWTSYQVMQQNSTMQWQKNKGCIYNETDLGTIDSIVVDSTEGTFTTYKGSASQPSTNGEGGYFQIKVGGATGKVNSITITFTK